MSTKKKTYDEVKQFIENKGYELLEDKYINSVHKMNLKCPKGHLIQMTWNTLQRGHKCVICEYSGRKQFSNEYLIDILKDFYNKNGFIPKGKEFTLYNLPSFSVYYERFGETKNLYNILSVDIPEYNRKNFSNFRGYTNNELIEILIKYNINNGFPVERNFTSANNLPSYTLYHQRFGSFKNAILLSNIKIPKDRERYFNRNKLTDNEMLSLLEYYTNKKLEKDMYLLNNNDVDECKGMPHSGTYASRFGGIMEAYSKIGINYNDFNNKALEKDMIKKYKELAIKLKHTPSSREIDKNSNEGFGYSMSAYENHFGGLYKLQIYCDLLPTIVGRNKSKDELIDDLIELYERLGRIPTQRDVNNCDWMASSQTYVLNFGGFISALNKADIKDDVQLNRCAITPSGKYCRSSYEYDFIRMLEDNNIYFKQEDYYYNYIPNFDRRYRFDFTININNCTYFIEIFGMMDKKAYKNKTEYKINLCKDNSLNLIDLYKEDFKGISHYNDLHKLLINKINSL